MWDTDAILGDGISGLGGDADFELMLGMHDRAGGCWDSCMGGVLL